MYLALLKKKTILNWMKKLFFSLFLTFAYMFFIKIYNTTLPKKKKKAGKQLRMTIVFSQVGWWGSYAHHYLVNLTLHSSNQHCLMLILYCSIDGSASFGIKIRPLWKFCKSFFYYLRNIKRSKLLTLFRTNMCA